MCTALETKFNQDAYIDLYIKIKAQNNKMVCPWTGNIADTYNLYIIIIFKEMTSIMGQYVIGRCKS